MTRASSSEAGENTRGTRRPRAGFIILVLAVAAASALTAFQVPLTSGHGVAIEAARVDGAVPLDPLSPSWSAATPTATTLTAQLVQVPQGGGNIPLITVRVAHNDTVLSVLLEWRDPTRDVGGYAPEAFSDAVAVQLVSTSDGAPPFVCMGQANFQTQVWHWKAERDPLAGGNLSLAQFYDAVYGDWYPFANDSVWYPGLEVGNELSDPMATPVQVLVAGGAGTITATGYRSVFGAGVWEAGTWRVVMARRLAAPNPDEVAIEPGAAVSVSFAAWDGSNGDRNGQKSVSSWYEMHIGFPGEAGGAGEWALRGVLGGLLVVLVFLILRRRRGRDAAAEPGPGPRGVDEIPDEEPEDAGRRQFLRATGVVAAGTALTAAPGAGLLPEPEGGDWPERKRVIDEAFERGYRDPDHLR